MPDDVSAHKERLRHEFRSFRSGLSVVEHETASRLISERLAALPAIRAAQVIHTFWPATERHEVDFRSVIRSWHSSGKTVVMPVNAGEQPPELRHVRFQGEFELVRNRWGIHEPSGGDYVPTSEIEVVIVPALGVGRAGFRIGYGKGYYDAFLRAVTALTVTPVYKACVLPSVPVEPHDIPVFFVVTEHEIIDTRLIATSQ